MSGKRLDRLYPGLSAKERVVLILQAMREDRQPDPKISWTMPAAQQITYHRLLGTINALNCDLAGLLLVYHEQAEKLNVRLGWLQTMELWGRQVGTLETWLKCECTDITAQDRKALRAFVRRAPTMHRLPFDLDEPLSECAEPSGDELARALAVTIRNALVQHWPEVRAVEIVAQELQDELGEDPLHPNVRETLDRTRETLLGVRDGMRPYAGEIELREPDEELALLRRLIDVVVSA